jgi:BlaI family transcriptional regulator, penicillinase repressor
MRRPKIRGAFTELEQAVMQVVWERGDASAEQVRQALEPSRVLKESTVRTMLSRLEEKGHLRHAVSGRTFIYSAAEAPENLAIRAVRQIVDKFCAGSVEQLVMGMVSNDLIDPGELKELAGRIAKSRANRKKEKEGEGK